MNELGLSARHAARGAYDLLVAHLPSLLGALGLVILGWLLALVLRRVAVRGVNLVEALLGSTAAIAPREGLRRSAAVVGTLVFWSVLLFFVTAATHVLGLVTFTDWLARLLEYLPTLAAGLLIIGAGILLARFVGDLVHATAKQLAAAPRAALSRLAQGATLTAALLVGADQIGIEVTWLAILATIVLAAVLGGVTIAASLGSRSYVANVIGAHYLRQAFRIGETVRVAGHEGRIVDVTATSLVLDTADGRLALPGRVFHDEAILLLRERETGDG